MKLDVSPLFGLSSGTQQGPFSQDNKTIVPLTETSRHLISDPVKITRNTLGLRKDKSEESIDPLTDPEEE